MVPSSLKELRRTRVQQWKSCTVRLSMQNGSMRRLNIMKMWNKFKKNQDPKLRWCSRQECKQSLNTHTCVRGVAKEACTKKLKASVAVTNEWLEMREWLSKRGCGNEFKGGHDLQKEHGKRRP